MRHRVVLAADEFARRAQHLDRHALFEGVVQLFGRTGISSIVRRYTIVTLAPNRSAVREASIAVLPAPMTITFLPRVNGNGVSKFSTCPCIRFTRVRNSLADMMPSRCSPGTFMKRGNPAPVPTKIFRSRRA